MSITTTFTVFDPDAASTYDFTSILRGFNVTQEIVPSKLGTGQGIFSLNNFDGNLTPNGDGTYAGVDWASCVVKLTVNRPSETVRTVFVGFIVDFTVIDDGTVSYVEFVCNDPYAIIGRGVTEESNPVGPLSYYKPVGAAIQDLVNLGSGAKTINGIALPTLNQTSAEAEVLDVSLVDPTLFYTRTEGAGYVEDNISYGILPASLGVMWPGSYRTSGGVVYWQAYCVGEGLTADTAVSYTFTDSPTGAADELVIGSLATGHNLGEIANSAQITTPQDSITYASQNTTSTDKYGAKSVSYSTHFEARNKQAYRFATGMATVDLDPYCDNITTRLGTYRYSARTVTTKASMNSSTNAEQAFVRLCDLLYGQWVPALVKYTPTGNSTQITDPVVITGRNIQGTPDDLRIQVMFRSAQDYQSFVLDSSVLGVLDQNRLG